MLVEIGQFRDRIYREMPTMFGVHAYPVPFSEESEIDFSPLVPGIQLRPDSNAVLCARIENRRHMRPALSIFRSPIVSIDRPIMTRETVLRIENGLPLLVEPSSSPS